MYTRGSPRNVGHPVISTRNKAASGEPEPISWPRDRRRIPWEIRRDKTGDSHLFICELHLWRALRYGERNPVRAKVARMPWRYSWSSAPAHVGEPDPSGQLDLTAWAREWKPESWRETLREPDDPDDSAKLRTCTHRGRPLATDSFFE